MEKRHLHAAKETEYLRLKRVKMSADDFTPLKVIGRGAFGEVKTNILFRNSHSGLFFLGSFSTKTRYRTYLCHENSSKRRYVSTRTSRTCSC